MPSSVSRTTGRAAWRTMAIVPRRSSRAARAWSSPRGPARSCAGASAPRARGGCFPRRGGGPITAGPCSDSWGAARRCAGASIPCAARRAIAWRSPGVPTEPSFSPRSSSTGARRASRPKGCPKAPYTSRSRRSTKRASRDAARRGARSPCAWRASSRREAPTRSWPSRRPASFPARGWSRRAVSRARSSAKSRPRCSRCATPAARRFRAATRRARSSHRSRSTSRRRTSCSPARSCATAPPRSSSRSAAGRSRRRGYWRCARRTGSARARCEGTEASCAPKCARRRTRPTASGSPSRSSPAPNASSSPA